MGGLILHIHVDRTDFCLIWSPDPNGNPKPIRRASGLFSKIMLASPSSRSKYSLLSCTVLILPWLMGKHSFAILWEVYNRYNRCHSSNIMVNLVLPCDFCDPAPELRIIHTSYEYCIHTVTYGDDANDPLPFIFLVRIASPNHIVGLRSLPNFDPRHVALLEGAPAIIILRPDSKHDQM